MPKVTPQNQDRTEPSAGSVPTHAAPTVPGSPREEARPRRPWSCDGELASPRGSLPVHVPCKQRPHCRSGERKEELDGRWKTLCP